MDLIRSHVMVCGGTNCSSSASGEIIREFERQIAEKGLEKEIKVVRTGCFGMCEAGPVVIVYPEGAFYARMTVENVTRIVDEHLVKGRVVKELLYKEAVDEDNKVKSLDSVDFYKKQRRVALRNCGVIDPENIDEYIAFDGYKALGKVLTEMTPQEVIDVMLKSGLRGRGGAGFPTGMKWKFAAASQSDKKYVCCNADEGDPGAFMDRSILEGDPHVVIEAMAIAAYAIGADQGYIYCRAEYPIAVKRLQIAIRQAREYGLLGKNIFGTDFCFDVDVRLGAGAFVCGEETALMTSSASAVPGGQGSVRKADHPQQRGDLRQRTADHQQRLGMVRFDRHGKIEGHQGVRAGRQDQQHRSGGGADGHHAARDHLRHRRRLPERQKVQGGADGRPLRRLHPGQPAGRADRL